MYVGMLPDDRASRIADLGCGAGQCLFFLQQEGYELLVGVDLSSEQIRIARDNVSADLRCEDAIEFLRNAPPASFDFFISNDLVEHLFPEAVERLCEYMFTALRPGGSIVLKTPNMDCPLALGARYNDFTHRIGFNSNSLTAVLDAAGFRDITTHAAATRRPRMIARLKRSINRIVWRLIYRMNSMDCPAILTYNLVCRATRPL